MMGAKLLKRWIGRLGYQQKEAAEILGFQESFFSLLVNGKRAPSLDKAIAIERVTGIPVEAWAKVGRRTKPRAA